MEQQLERIYKAIREDLLALFQLILEDDRYGTNDKVGINTLKDSRLHDEAYVESKDNIFTLYYNDYLQYIETGRKPYTKKVPIVALFEWMKRKHISNDVRVAYAIQQSIYVNGITARPLLEPFEGELDRIIDEWLDRIFNAIVEQLNTYFNNK